MDISSLRCSTKSGGCGSDGRWRAAIDRAAGRIILDCMQCSQYRLSLPLATTMLTKRITGLDETGKAVKTRQEII